MKEKVLFPWICKNNMSELGITASQQYQLCLSTSSPSLPTQLISLYLFTSNIKHRKLDHSHNPTSFSCFCEKWRKKTKFTTTTITSKGSISGVAWYLFRRKHFFSKSHYENELKKCVPIATNRNVYFFMGLSLGKKFQL